MTLSSRISELTRHLHHAGELARSVQRQYAGESLAKDDRSPVTIGDLAIQTSVTLALDRIDPGIPLVGEEGSETLRGPEHANLVQRICEVLQPLHGDISASRLLDLLDRGQYDPRAKNSRFWVLDPIDGTKGFLRGDQYAIALGHIDAGAVTAGILSCPALPNGLKTGLVAAAERGQGAWLMNGVTGSTERRLAVSKEKDIREARFCESVEASHSSHSKAARVGQMLGIQTDPVRMDSQCKYVCIADGWAEIYMRLPVRTGYVEKIWDHAAGTILVEEAGGIVTDAWGEPLDFSQGRLLSVNQGVLASNGAEHARLAATVSKVFRDAPITP